MRLAPLVGIRLTSLSTIVGGKGSPSSSHFRPGLGLFIVLYLIVHTAIRLRLYGYLEHDEAEELFRCQTLSWGYTAQPPLYAWLVWGAVQLFGVTVFSLTVVKVSLLFGLYTLLDRVASRCLTDPLLARLATVSLFLIPIFSWELPRMAVSLLLCVAVLGMVLSLLRIRERGAIRDYAAMGFWLAVGMVSKYNFSLFAVLLFAAALCDGEFRRRIVCWRMFGTVALAILLVAPHTLWVIDHLPVIAARIEERAQMNTPRISVVRGVWNLTTALVVSLSILFAAVVVCFREACLRRPDAPGNDRTRLIGRFVTGVFAALLLIVVFAGVRSVRAYWLAPAFLLTPLLAFAHLERRRVPRGHVYAFGLIAVCGGLATLTAQAAPLCWGVEGGKFQTRDFLYAEHVRLANEESFGRGPIVASDCLVAGYERMYFPDRPVHCLAHPAAPVRDGFDAEPIMLVWDASAGEGIPIPFAEYLRTRLAVTLPNEATPRYVTVTPRPIRGTMTKLGFVIVRRE